MCVTYIHTNTFIYTYVSMHVCTVLYVLYCMYVCMYIYIYMHTVQDVCVLGVRVHVLGVVVVVVVCM